MPIFDLHCDTLYECLKQGKKLKTNDLDLSFDRLAGYGRFCQVLAMWSDYRLDDDKAYERFFEARDMLRRQLDEADDVKLVTNAKELGDAFSSGNNAVFLAVEGGKLLGQDIKRLDALYDAGVRFLTLVWNGHCAIGGSHDNDDGLTDFGREVVGRCLSLGIIPDVSHASDKMIDETLEICESAGKVCVATHSNSRAVCDHRRNLTDNRFRRISSLGGIVGVSLAPQHLTSDENCTVDDVVRHIDHYMSLGGEDTVCLGCDLDGVGKLPDGISGVQDLTKIAEKLAQINYTDSLVEKIFYANARNFIFHWIQPDLSAII